jgi:Iap family predicted aminopeptidase
MNLEDAHDSANIPRLGLPSITIPSLRPLVSMVISRFASDC